MHVSTFRELGLKMLVHTPKWFFWGFLPDKWWAISSQPRKGTCLHINTAHDVSIVKSVTGAGLKNEV